MQFRVVIGDALGERHHQGDRVVGDLPRAVVRHIADRDAQFAEALDIDVVVADAVLHEDPAGRSLSMYGGGHPPTTASAFAHCSSLTSSNFSRNSNSNPEPTASVATGPSRAGKFGQRMRIAMTSPSFDVMAKVPSPPRHDQTRATDRNQAIRSDAVRIAAKRDQARAAAIAARLEQVAEPCTTSGFALLYLDGENIAALWLIERKERLSSPDGHRGTWAPVQRLRYRRQYTVPAP